MNMDHHKDLNWKTMLALAIAGPIVLCLVILLSPFLVMMWLGFMLIGLIDKKFSRN